MTTNIQMSRFVRRDEWYAPIDKSNTIVGDNPRCLNFSKPGNSDITRNIAKTVNCGFVGRIKKFYFTRLTIQVVLKYQ